MICTVQVSIVYIVEVVCKLSTFNFLFIFSSAFFFSGNSENFEIII
jgi:hypothetical protein